MPIAVRAPVSPRILSRATGAALPLEDEVQSRLDAPGPALLELAGGPGSGKTTALRHLAAVFAGAARLKILDRDADRRCEWRGDEVIVFVGRTPRPTERVEHLVLAPWHRDDLMEYLLAQHPQQTATILGRISNMAIQEFRGKPEIWRIVLDELALDDTLADAQAALVKNMRSRISSEELWEQISGACLEDASYSTTGLEDISRLLVQPPVRQLLAAEHLATKLSSTRHRCRLPEKMPRALVHAVARRVSTNEIARGRLNRALRSRRQQPMATSLLRAIDPSWRPLKTRRMNLAGAHLDSVSWPGIRLRSAKLREVDFSGADLRGALLDNADAFKADLRDCCLAGASLKDLDASSADLSDADLSRARAEGALLSFSKLSGTKLDDASLSRTMLLGADLRGASLRRADLTRAVVQAKLAGADFTKADLTDADLHGQDLRDACFEGARLTKGNLRLAHLEGMQLDGVDLAGACLEGALLTSTSIRRGDLSGCNLRGAGLADIDWEGACLNGADLRGASFHLGSSRSGLVGSPIASEGSRTGFYTDEYHEQDYKPPEEIRKANLCYADLRGACVDYVDFYLVDLRGAEYDLKQAEHFLRCGAILEDRCPQ
jgi:uncharacterized protein YjbI with pentapeptide repeats